MSLRWLAGTVLTGITSLFLMGGALYAALDGRPLLARPADAMSSPMNRASATAVSIGGRVAQPIAAVDAPERVLLVPTRTTVGDQDVIRKRPFAYAEAPLAIAGQIGIAYPAFDPLAVFRAAGDDEVAAAGGEIYVADIESEVVVSEDAFTPETSNFAPNSRISLGEAQQQVMSARASLAEGDGQVLSAAYLDDTRFSLAETTIAAVVPDISVVAQNVSTVLPSGNRQIGIPSYREMLLPVRAGQTIESVIDAAGLSGDALSDMLAALAGEFGAGPVNRASVIRVAVEDPVDQAADALTTLTTGLPVARPTLAPPQVRRIGVYRAGNHLKSIATNDRGTLVWATPPPLPDGLAAMEDILDAGRRPRLSATMPTIYDGIHHAVLSQGLDLDAARRVIRTVAFDVDFRSPASPTDTLEVFYSLHEGASDPGDIDQLLQIALTVGNTTHRYYRFTTPDDGRTDFYDMEGKSAKKFLMRKPVPNAKFGSPFGPRRHPISRRVKMHQGVDFSAPRGTPILAAGNGVVESAKWAGGYGRQTIIRHANGYKTSYSHQQRFARGIKEGAYVRQGQVIGQVGSTGYSTGPHLHYEVTVNGNRVNPMKIRLPKGQVLTGDNLKAFRLERDRIDTLIQRGRSGATGTIASL